MRVATSAKHISQFTKREMCSHQLEHLKVTQVIKELLTSRGKIRPSEGRIMLANLRICHSFDMEKLILALNAKLASCRPRCLDCT
jgi:hypothetical protein